MPVNDKRVNQCRRNLESRLVGARVLLDLTANQTIEDDPYLLLAQEVKRQRSHVIGDPGITANPAHNRSFHHLTVENGIPVPEAILVDRRNRFVESVERPLCEYPVH